jgi:hypothetical protein
MRFPGGTDDRTVPFIFTGFAPRIFERIPSMKFRRVVSLTSLVSFVLLLLTSVVLFFTPQGRVAYWSDWSFWGLSKTSWGDLHINLGVLFLIAIFLHIYYNWSPILAYLRTKVRKRVGITPEMGAAVAVTVLVAFGTGYAVPPFSWILDFNAHLQDAGARKYGEPPYGHAELSSLTGLARQTGMEPAAALDRLKSENIRFESADQTVLDVARANGVSPKDVFAAMKPAEPEQSVGPRPLPETPFPGLGRKTLTELSDEYGLDAGILVDRLNRQGLTVTPDMAIRDAAEENGLAPQQFYEKLREIAGE